jgi:hypothetical protein
MSVAAGWYTDPAQSGRVRWWDGQQWTDHVRDAEMATVAPAASAAAFAHPVAAQPAIGGVGVASAAVAYAVADPSTFPYSTPSLPAHAAAQGPRPELGWLRPVLATVLVGVLAVGGFFGYRALTSSASPEVVPTAQPLVAPVDARTAATMLDAFKPRDNTPAAGITSTLVPKGDTLSSPTLTDWCATASHTDDTRIARRQWMFVRNGKNAGASVEVAAYATSAQAKAAFDEFVAMSASCTAKVVHAPKGTVTFHRVSVSDASPDPDIRYELTILQEDGVVAATKQTLKGWMSGTVQQRGQFVSIVWSGQTRNYTAADLAVLQRLAHDQALVLRSAPLS